MDGNVDSFVYRLCKYTSDNLLTFEIDDDDDEIETIQLSSDEEVPPFPDSDDEAVNIKEEQDVDIQLTVGFNSYMKKESEDLEEYEEQCKQLKVESSDFFELDAIDKAQSQVNTSCDPHLSASEDDGGNSYEFETNSNDSTETVHFSPGAPQKDNAELSENVLDDEKTVKVSPNVQTTNNETLLNDRKEGSDKSSDHTATDDNNYEDKLKQTLTKLNDSIKRKRKLEIIEAKPLEKRCKAKTETTPNKTHIRDKLKNITTTKPKSVIDEKDKTITTAKVKFTPHNRGYFLTDPTQIPVLPGSIKMSISKSSTSRIVSSNSTNKPIPTTSKLPNMKSLSSKLTVKSSSLQLPNAKRSPSQLPSANSSPSQIFDAIPSCSKLPFDVPVTAYQADKQNIELPKYKEDFKEGAFQLDPRHEIISKLTSYDAERYQTVEAFCRSNDKDISSFTDAYHDHMEYRR